MPGNESRQGRLVSLFKGKAKETSQQTSSTQAAAASPATDNVLFGSPRAIQQFNSESLTAAPSYDLVASTTSFIEDRSDLYGLKPLAGLTVDDAALDPLSPDIIAVHGIDGNAWKTWEHSNGKLWLRDFLPKHVPGARIYSFGYPAEIAFTKGRGDLSGFARSLLEGLNSVRYNERLEARPIIFICHSMGGLVVKQALITASLDRDDYGHTRDSTRGILFLSTPHRGSTSIPWPKLLSRIGNVALEYTKLSGWLGVFRTDLLTLLEKDSQQLVDITLNFRNQHKGIKIVSFYEGDATAPFKEPVVDVATGVLGFEGETVVPMDGCDHHTICRFPSENNSYNLILGQIRKISSDKLFIRDNYGRVALTESVESRIRIPKAEFFGRHDELNELYRFLEPEDLARKGVVIWSLSGYGKTQLALHYIDQFRSLYSSLLWIDASSKDSCEESFKEIRYQLLRLDSRQTRLTDSANLDARHSAVVDDVIHWLRQDTNKSWLMVFDSVDSREELDIRNYIPECEHGKLIITTTLSDLCSPLKLHGIELGGMDDFAGSKILLKTLEDVTPNQSTQDLAKSISRKLKGIPLAIEQAGAFLSFGIVSIHDYNRLFETKYREHTLKVSPRGYHCCYEKNRSICVALDMLLETLQDQSPHSVKLLKLSVLLGPGEISFSMLANAPLPREKSYLEPDQVSSSTEIIWPLDIGAWLIHLRCDESSFGAAVQKLEQACLAKFTRDRDCQITNYLVHDMVRSWILGKLSKEEISEYAITAFALIGTLLYDQSGLCSSQAMQNHTVRLNAILKIVSSNVSEEIIKMPDGKYASLYGSVASGFGKFCRLQGQLQKANKLLNAAIECHMFLGQIWPTKQEHLTELEEIAIIEWQLGNLDLAIDKYKSLLDQCKLILGEFDDMTVKIAISLRKLRERRDTDNQAAERAYYASRSVKTGHDVSSEPPQYQQIDDKEWELKEAYEEAKNLLGGNDLETTQRAEKLAAYYQNCAKPQQEEPVREFIWQYYFTKLTPTNTISIRSLYELCKCYQETGKLTLELRGKLKLAHNWAKESNFRPLQVLLRRANTHLVFSAARDGNHNLVSELLDQQMVHVDSTDRHKNTALHFASRNGHELVIQLLLENGYDIDARTDSGYTALHSAAGNGHLAAALLLLKKGIDIKAKTHGGWTCLHVAAQNGHIEMFNRLIELGLDPKEKTNKGWTSVHIAAKGGNVEILEHLIELGVDPKEKANHGWTAIHAAADGGHMEMLDRLIELGLDPKEKTSKGWTPIHIAAKSGHVEMLEPLIELGVDPKEKANTGWTSVHAAADGGRVEMLNRIIELGVDPKEKSNRGWTPLHIAADRGYIETLGRLIEIGVDPKEKLDAGRTSVHLAARGGHVEMLDRLIELGLDPKEKSNDGWTSLHLAAEGGHVEMLDRLIELGLDPKEKTNDGFTSLHIAADRGHVKIFGRLIELGVDPRGKSMDGCTALQLSARGGHIAIMNWLFNVGIVDGPDYLGFTALHEAVHYLNADVVNALINGGSDIHSLDPYGYSPLELAARTPEIYHDVHVMLQKVEPVAETIRKAKRKSSIVKVIVQLRNFPERRRVHAISTLGRLLLFNGDENNALIAFIRNARLRGSQIEHSNRCDLCSSEDYILGTRYICRQCIDTNLCSLCMKTYSNNPIIPGCRDHDFFSIPQAEMDDFSTYIDSINDSAFNELLEQLWTMYRNNGQG